jgi:hypothetical protein
MIKGSSDMLQMVAFYRLKPSVSMEDYWKWSVETDQPITSAQPGVRKFEAYQTTHSGEGPHHYDVVEVIEVDSWEAWEQVAKLPAMKKVVDEWPLYCDGASVLLARLRKIE